MYRLKLNISGESHSEYLTMRLGGIKNGENIDLKQIQAFVNTRKSGNGAWSTRRSEPDEIELISGIENGVTTGEDIVFKIYNKDTKSNDYEAIKYIPRPSHADYVSSVKDKTGCCPVGGGRFSGRLTAPLTIAGGIAKELLSKRNIYIGAYVSQIGNVKGKSYLNSDIFFSETETALNTPLKALSNIKEMEEEIFRAKSALDSVGGIVECIVFNMPVGVGDSGQNGLEGAISSMLFSIPAVKGVEFGSGFLLANMKGSESNDSLRYQDGKVITLTNHSGGINGGISNSMPITMRVAIKPTPSISKKQLSINLLTKENCELEINGRHDACIVPRAVSPVISAAALAILDQILIFEE